MFTKKINLKIFFLSLFLFFCMVDSASAATLKFSATQGYAIGATIPVKVLVTTDGLPLNAVSASISYPIDKLQLQSVSKAGSIISYWVEEPTTSVPGTVSLEGLVLNPGWSGNSGTVVTLNFKVVSSGSANLGFAKASILANDGLGTNILTSAIPTVINLTGGAPVLETEEAVTSGTPSAPQIKSETHPNQNAWYKSNDPSFSWSLPSGVSAVRLLYDKNPNSTPSVEYSPAISNKTLEDVSDGIYYLHVQFKNANGWGGVGHYKFQIDTEAPQDFDITLAHAEDASDPRPIIYFNTTDSVSGIEKYIVKIGTEAGVTIAQDDKKSNPYTPPNLNPGENKIRVIAYDRAGNILEKETIINIEVIDSPKIQEFPSTLDKGELLRIRGSSYPNVVVTVSIKNEDGIIETDTARTNSLGNFSLLWTKNFEKGIYTFTAFVQDDKGAKSYPTEEYTFKVSESLVAPGVSLVKDIFYFLLASILGVALLWAIVIYVYHHLNYFNRHVESRLHNKFHKVEDQIEHDFDLLREELELYIEKMRKAEKTRKLSKEEKEFINNFKKYISAVEKDIVKKVDALEGEE